MISKNAVGEKEILLSPYNPLHDIASAEIKKKSEWAAKVLVALLQLQEAHSRSKGSLRKNALAGVARLWSKFPEAPTLSNTQMLVIKAYDKVAGMRGKNESRRVSMEDYDAESAEYYGPSNSEGPRENIYLKNEAKKSVTQCFNIVRSKLTIESRMYKKGTTSPELHSVGTPQELEPMRRHRRRACFALNETVCLFEARPSAHVFIL